MSHSTLKILFYNCSIALVFFEFITKIDDYLMCFHYLCIKMILFYSASPNNPFCNVAIIEVLEGHKYHANVKHSLIIAQALPLLTNTAFCILLLIVCFANTNSMLQWTLCSIHNCDASHFLSRQTRFTCKRAFNSLAWCQCKQILFVCPQKIEERKTFSYCASLISCRICKPVAESNWKHSLLPHLCAITLRPNLFSFWRHVTHFLYLK